MPNWRLLWYNLIRRHWNDLRWFLVSGQRIKSGWINSEDIEWGEHIFKEKDDAVLAIRKHCR